MNEDLRREFRAIQSAHQVLAGAYGRLADLFPVDAPGPEPPEPQRSWTLEHTPTDAIPARRLIIDPMTIEAVEAVRITLRITLAKPLPPTGGEMFWAASYDPKTKDMLFRETVASIRHNNTGIRGVGGGIGDPRGKTREDVPGLLRVNQETVIIVEIRLGRTMTIMHGEITRVLYLTGEKAIVGPWAIQLGGENPLLGSPHWVEVELL